MNPIHTVVIRDVSGKQRTLKICVGDVTDTSNSDKVDVLAISCFSNDYTPLLGTIVGQLKTQGIDLRELAEDKALDERARWQTWISQPLSINAPFGRIACFEHGKLKQPGSAVGNFFRALTGFALTYGNGELGIIRVPLLATGNQRADKAEMLDAIIRQAYNQLRLCLPVESVEVVLYSGWDNLHELIFKAALTIKQVQDEWSALKLSPDPLFEYFISYRRIDQDLLDKVLNGIKVRKPNARIFLDKQVLSHGVFWKPELIGSIYNSKKFLCIITDSYVESGECIDEFHAALSCGIYRSNFLIPLLSLTNRKLETLPASFRSVNLIEARCPPRIFDEVLADVFYS